MAGLQVRVASHRLPAAPRRVRVAKAGAAGSRLGSNAGELPTRRPRGNSSVSARYTRLAPVVIGRPLHDQMARLDVRISRRRLEISKRFDQRVH